MSTGRRLSTEFEVRDTAREYCQENLSPRIIEAARTECEYLHTLILHNSYFAAFDGNILKELGELGMLGGQGSQFWGVIFI
jgi:hypothetical protein